MRNFITFLIFILAFTEPALAAGPWKGKVIDTETKEPIEGAVVLAVWDRNYRTPTGGSSYFYEAKEVLTDKEGRFEIPAYTPINLLPLISYIEGPFFTIFKPGYGSFPKHHISPPKLGIDPADFFSIGKLGEEGEMGWDYEKGKSIKVTFGIVELPPLKTREEGLKNMPAVSVPYKKQKLLIKLINEERKNLGLEGELKIE